MGWVPTSEIWVPHLRDGFIVAKVGYGSQPVRFTEPLINQTNSS